MPGVLNIPEITSHFHTLVSWSPGSLLTYLLLSWILTQDHAKDLCASEPGPLRI